MESTYKIGAVEKLTGIPAVTIRMWERRYQAVTPHRTPSNGRLYSRSQVARLSLLKRLVDGGDAISSVASLSDVELGARLGGMAAFAPGREGPIGVVIVGSLLVVEPEGDALVMLGNFASAEEALRAEPLSADALVVELAIVTPETGRLIASLCSRFSPSTVLIVYQFGASASLQRLHRAGYHTVPAPLHLPELANILSAFVGVAPERPIEEVAESPHWLQNPIPPRRFSAEELRDVAQRVSAVRCECPQHLTTLINRLLAFEDYSRDCESRNASDAALHMQLHQASAHARAVLEDALARLIRHELAERAD